MEEKIKKAQEAVWYNTDCKLLTKERKRKRFQAKRIILELLEGIGWAIWLLILLILSCGDTLIYLLYLAISVLIFIQKIKYDCRSNDRNLCNSMHNTVTTEKEEREDKGTDTK